MAQAGMKTQDREDAIQSQEEMGCGVMAGWTVADFSSEDSVRWLWTQRESLHMWYLFPVFPHDTQGDHCRTVSDADLVRTL